MITCIKKLKGRLFGGEMVTERYLRMLKNDIMMLELYLHDPEKYEELLKKAKKEKINL